jgi:hypothetical protein
MIANKRRVKWLSANNRQQFRTLGRRLREVGSALKAAGIPALAGSYDHARKIRKEMSVQAPTEGASLCLPKRNKNPLQAIVSGRVVVTCTVTIIVLVSHSGTEKSGPITTTESLVRVNPKRGSLGQLVKYPHYTKNARIAAPPQHPIQVF